MTKNESAAHAAWKVAAQAATDAYSDALDAPTTREFGILKARYDEAVEAEARAYRLLRQASGL